MNGQLKRYVVEYANDIIREAERAGRNDIIATVSRIVSACEHDYITRHEAMRELTRAAGINY